MATGTIPSHRGTKHLVKRHGYKLGYTVTKVHLQRAGLVVPAARRSAHRKKRPRRPLEGMLVHQDGSRFAWLPGDPRQYALIVTLDDATSAPYSAFLVEEEGTAWSFRGLREVVKGPGLGVRGAARMAHRKNRPRRPRADMLVHQDVSRHAWLPGEPRQYDLIVTLDYDTSAIYAACLVEEEGTAASFRGLRGGVTRHGLFCALYTDRGSHYFHTPEAGGKVDKRKLTQVGRALAQLGIEHIAAYSPEARGRSEQIGRAHV